MILYALIGIVILYLLFFAFIKIKFRFWASQPVFHLYNLFYWIWPCGIIEHGLPLKTKFYDAKVVTKKWQDFPLEKKALFYTLIKSHFLNEKKEKYNPPKHAVLNYFYAHNRNCHLSLQFELLPNTNQPTQKVVSAMTTRPLNASLNSNDVKIDYVDFLCVHKSYRKKGLAQKIIYSHYFNSRKDKAGPVFLFKREGRVNFITPLTVYTANVFSLKHLKHVNLELPNNIICHLINDSNFSLFAHFLEEIKNQFKCFIIPEISHIKHLVSKKLLFICLIMEGQDPIATYIYRNPHTSYEEKQSVELIASYYKFGYYDEYIKSFRNTIALINEIFSIDILILERISNNTDLNNFLIKRYPVLWKCPMAYFLYNFAYRPFFPSDVFLIN